jgi:hypothetical protein
MCTVTVLPRSLLPSDPSPDRLLLRVACNRDELLTRAPALPPTLWAAGARRALMPIDPESGGTWIAANDAGLIFVLLNARRASVVSGFLGRGSTRREGGSRTRGTLAKVGDISRGTIIPTLISSATPSRALAQAQRLQAGRFSPFRLLIINRHEVVECWPDGDCVRHRRRSLQGAILRTSSGLGDAVVAGPRRALFQRAFSSLSDLRAAQDHFHQHQWPGREAISVNMSRRDARTVSQTVVEVRDGSVLMSYRAAEWPHAVAGQVAA